MESSQSQMRRIGGGIVLVLLLFGWWYFVDQNKNNAVQTFAVCEEKGYDIVETKPRTCRTPDGRVFIEGGKNNEVRSSDIRITLPLQNASVDAPVLVRGEARGSWYFEADFPVRVESADGRVLGQGYASAEGDWMTEEFVPFSGTVSFDAGNATNGYIVFERDNPSGLSENSEEVRVPVQFEQAEQVQSGTMTVYAYFVDQAIAEVRDCAAVVAVPRDIARTTGVARASIAELLKGPTSAEMQRYGVVTHIPTGVQLNSVRIVDGVAYVDFSEALEAGGGTSCQSSAIRSQITNTLKRFATVNDVVISIEGESEVILQP